MEQQIQTVRPHVHLVRDTETGIAFVKDGTSGLRLSVHPSIAETGSVEGMISRGYWSAGERTVHMNGFIYNIDHCVVSGEMDELVRKHCQCGGVH